MRSRRRVKWDAQGVRALRHHLGMTQQEMAGELGVRQQTVSEWETGSYRPRGPSATLLSLVAERAGFQYEGGQPQEKGDARVIPHAPLAQGSAKHENVIPAPERESRVRKPADAGFLTLDSRSRIKYGTSFARRTKRTFS